MFEAVAGEGAGELIGQRFPSSTGIAGWVLVTRQPLVVEELQSDPRFAREAAESTGFVPKGADGGPAPARGRALGVLEVLDRPAKAAFSLAGDGAARPVRQRGRDRAPPAAKAREARAVLETEGGEAEAVARFVSLLADAEPERKEAALRLLRAVEELLRER